MLCEKCGQREASIHFTSIVYGQMTKRDLCEECGRDTALSLPRGLSIDALPFRAQISEILVRDQRYQVEAYEFVKGALDKALLMKGPVREISRHWHVSGKELLEVLRIFALLRFGKDAKRCFNEWGVKSCEDFGEIVFNLVDAGLLGKQPTDRKEDFQGGYDFDKAFPES